MNKGIYRLFLIIFFLAILLSVTSFSILWAVDIKGTVGVDNIIGTVTDDDMRGFRVMIF
jgi:hypothetical protein